MLYQIRRSWLLTLIINCFFISAINAQTSVKLTYTSSQYAGIEVGSKGVKLSIVDIAKNVKTNKSFTIIKDTSVNTDFISFTAPASEATLKGLYNLYQVAVENYNIPSANIYTVISSGVKVQAEKEEKNEFIRKLVESFKEKINDEKEK